MTDDVPKRMLRAQYRRHPPCPRCGERAVRLDEVSDAGRFQCDACGAAIDLEFDPLSFDHESVDDDELYDPDIDELDDVLDVDDVDVSGSDAGAKLASALLFGFGVLLCLSVIGIPFGLALMAIAVKISPNDPEWQGLPRGDDDDDN